MANAATEIDAVRHAGYRPGEFPATWHDVAYALHAAAWAAPWQGQLARERFVAELNSDHVDVLFDATGGRGRGELLAYLKWKATAEFFHSRDRLSDPALVSLLGTPPARYVCAYEITTTTSRWWQGLGRRLLQEALRGWERDFTGAVFCTYSPKRRLTATLRHLDRTRQHGRPALEAFAHRAGAAAARHADDWTARLEESLYEFIRREIVPQPDERIMEHLETLKRRYGDDVIQGVVGAIGIAYNFVLRAASGQPACGPVAFHRALGAEHWRQYPFSATGCADALGLVDHWRYSNDPQRRALCIATFRQQRQRQARRGAGPQELLVRT